MPGPDPRKAKLMQGPQARGKQSDRKEQKEKDKKIIMMIGDKEYEVEKMAKGGRAGYKAGSKGCKLAMKGKGRAYGKNS
jgi:hypothetical protein